VADPLRRVQRGQKLKDGLTAGAWNKFLDNLKDGREIGAGDITDLVSPADTVLMVWGGDPEQTLKAFSVLGYGDPVRSPVDNPFIASERPIFESADATAKKPFAITLRPVDGGKVVKVAISGTVPVIVDVGDASHARARPIVSETGKLESCSSGGVPILWKESGTGDKWAMVLLDFADPAGAGVDCSTLSGLIRSGFCGSLSRVSADGSCDCVPSNTVSLTWDADADAAVGAADDPILGCPPGVVTTLCPDGAPKKFKIVVSGFTAPNTNLNQTYTVTYTTGEIWTQVKNGVTATLTAVTATGNFNFSLDDGSVTVLYSTGMAVPLSCCADVDLELDDADGTSGTPATLTALVATACGTGTEYTPYLDLCDTDCEGPKPRLRLVPTSGGTGSAAIVCTPVGCGTDGDGSPYMDFATSDPAICTGAVDECGENAVVFRVTCGPCPCDCSGSVEYTTAGWYRVSGNLTGDCCEYYSSNPGGGVTLCAGPYTTKASCEDVCDDNGWNGVGYYCTSGGCEFLAENPGNSVYLCAGPFTTVEDCEGAECSNGNTVIACGGTPSPKWVIVKVWMASDNECAGLAEWFPELVEALVEVPDSGSAVVQLDGPAVLQQPPADAWDWDYTQLWTEGQDINLKGPPVWSATVRIGCDGSGGYQNSVDDGPGISAPGQINIALYVPGGADCILNVIDGPNYGPFSIEYKADVPVDSTPGSCNYGVIGPPFNKAKFHVRIEAASDGCATDRNIPSENVSTEYFICRGDNCTQCTDRIGEATYNCLGTGSCIDPGDGTGEYATTAECLAACGGGGGGGGGGPSSNCGKGAGSASDTLVITGGAQAGTYSGTWFAGSPDYEAFTLPGGTLVLEFFGGAWHIVKSFGGITDETATGGTCSPFQLRFAGSTIPGATLIEVNP